MRPHEWTGKAEARSFSLGPLEFGSIRLPNFDTSPARLSIGGVNVGKDGFPVGGWFADGTFTVEPCGHTGPQTEFATTTTRLDPPDWVV